jgi:hypothetical protein
MRLTGLLFAFVAGLACASTSDLWKNLWIAGQGISREAADRWFACSGSTRFGAPNCMEMMGLVRRGALFTSSFQLTASKYSCFKGFHRSALLQGYNSRSER